MSIDVFTFAKLVNRITALEAQLAALNAPKPALPTKSDAEVQAFWAAKRAEKAAKAAAAAQAAAEAAITKAAKPKARKPKVTEALVATTEF